MLYARVINCVFCVTRVIYCVIRVTCVINRVIRVIHISTYVFTEWSRWECDVTCGIGQWQSRRRTCNGCLGKTWERKKETCFTGRLCTGELEDGGGAY